MKQIYVAILESNQLNQLTNGSTRLAHNLRVYMEKRDNAVIYLAGQGSPPCDENESELVYWIYITLHNLNHMLIIHNVNHIGTRLWIATDFKKERKTSTFMREDLVVNFDL